MNFSREKNKQKQKNKTRTKHTTLQILQFNRNIVEKEEKSIPQPHWPNLVQTLNKSGGVY